MGTGENTIRNALIVGRSVRRILIGSVAIILIADSTGDFIGSVQAQAQAQQNALVARKSFNIRTTDLGKALTLFADRAGLKLVFPSARVAGRMTAGLDGSYTNDEALARLLAGTGLTYEFVSTNAVTIIDPNVSTGGDLNDVNLPIDFEALAPVVVAGSGATVPYTIDAPVAAITAETIERFPGSSPADIFRGTPGVMSGESRNGAGSIDVNIRGMQGLGRVAVTVDGTMNATSIYQGYQGISNRTFVDPDLLGGVEITKGSDMASNGIAGTVAMRTIDAGDIVQQGKRFGTKLRLGFGTNTTTPPPPGTPGGYEWPTITDPRSALVPSQDGLDRPNWFTPTDGSMSMAVGYKGDAVDLIGGYAYRNRGNYFAGKNGDAARPKDSGVVRTYCPDDNTLFCSDLFKQFLPNLYVPEVNGPPFFENDGPVNYRKGEEVLNTELTTKSFLGKATIRVGDDQAIKVGYTGFRSEAGDRLSSRLADTQTQPFQNPNTSGTTLDTGTLEYRWQPENTLFDLSAKLWGTRLELLNQRAFQLQTFGATELRGPAYYGLPSDFRNGTDNLMWGVDVSNDSSFSGNYGDVNIDIGLSYLVEDTKPDDKTEFLLDYMERTGQPFTYVKPRDGIRKEISGYSKWAWSPFDWLTAKAGLKYQKYQSEDRDIDQPTEDQESDGFSQSVGLTLAPVDGVQVYGQYSSALRLPSLFESVSVGAVQSNSELQPERSNNWEFGANLIKPGLLTDEDELMIKVGYFNWIVDDYVAREFFVDPSNGFFGLRMFNIDQARFSGLELSGRYEISGFAVELAANYYTDVTFCPTANTCEDKSLYADFSTNQIPPEYMVSATLSQKFFNDALTVGGRITRIGPRAIGHGEPTGEGAQQFIVLVDWQPHTLFDAFVEYKINDRLALSLTGENLTDQFYIDPLSLANQPAPGRTFYGSLTVKF